MIETASGIAQLGYEQHGVVADFADECERRIFAVTEQRTAQSFVHLKPVIAQTFKTIQSLYERQEEITGIPTGFADLDRLTSGFQPGDLVILAARPSMGKTGCALNIATHVGCRGQYQQKPCGVGIFSLEMPKEQLVMRMLSSEARVDSQRIRTGKLIESDCCKWDLICSMKLLKFGSRSGKVVEKFKSCGMTNITARSRISIQSFFASLRTLRRL